MPAFRYNGRTSRGEAVAGSLESESAETLATHLFARGITPIDIKPVVVTRDVLGELWLRLGGGRPTVTDLILFSRQMYSITKAGVPLLRGMQSIAASTVNPVMRTTLLAVIESLQAGRDLTFAFGRFPDVFSKFYLSVIKVGESSGTLEMAFLRMYEFLGMQKRVRDKVKAALRYPATVVIAIAIAMGVITMFVLPKFAPIFAALGNNLPWATRVLMGVSTFASEYWYLVIGACVAVTVVFRLWVRDPAGRYKWDKLKLKTPVVGGIVRRASLAQICRSFALTLEAGVPMIQSLSTIARATGNDYLTERVFALRDGVERGEGLYRTAQTVDLFTPLALQMIAIGEETGALGDMLGEVAEFYEREVDYELENLSAAIEPLLIVGVGGMVLVLALGVFLPLWDMAAKGTGLGGSGVRMRRSSGFSLVEFMVVVIAILILTGALLDRVLPLIGRAQRAAFVQVKADLQTALLFEAAERVTRGEAVALQDLAERNPMTLLLTPPANYVGSFEQPQADDLPAASWYFDEHTHRLVYRVGRYTRFDALGGPPGRVELKTEFVFDDRNGDGIFEPGPDDFRGLKLTPVHAFAWPD